MPKPIKLSVVFPAYNEEKGITDVILRTKEVLKRMNISSEIIVVDDGSKDQTAVLARAAKVVVLSHKRNKGYGAALQTGFLAAKGTLVCCLDADGTYPPEEIPKLLHYFETKDLDMISGARLLGKCEGMPFIRKVGNTILSWIASLLLGRRIHDLASGMRLLRKQTLIDLLPLSDELDFTVCMMLKSAAKKMRFKEVAIRYDEREGSSKLQISKHGNMFFQSILHVTRDYRPLRLFVPVSFFFIFIAVLNAGQLLIRRILGELTTSLTNGLVITGGLLLLGIHIFIFGILADMIASLKDEKK
jgi:glycosyltransferase involved in cell wall biosynthesis